MSEEDRLLDEALRLSRDEYNAAQTSDGFDEVP